MNRIIRDRLVALETRFGHVAKDRRQRASYAKVVAFRAMIEAMRGQKPVESRTPNPGYDPGSRQYPLTGNGPARKRFDEALQLAREWIAKGTARSAGVTALGL